ncbi:MAG: hypothetical protein ABEH43_09735, partial [Flavobacteriales bacterium]
QTPLEFNDKLSAKLVVPSTEDLRREKARGTSMVETDNGLVYPVDDFSPEKLSEVLENFKTSPKSPEKIKEELDNQRKSNPDKVKEMMEKSGKKFTDLSKDAEFLKENGTIRPADDGSIDFDYLENWGNLLAYIFELAEIGGFEVDKNQILEEIEEVKKVNLPPTGTIFELKDNKLSLMGCF